MSGKDIPPEVSEVIKKQTEEAYCSKPAANTELGTWVTASAPKSLDENCYTPTKLMNIHTALPDTMQSWLDIINYGCDRKVSQS